ncbi:MAG: hypothetical protein ACJASL_003901 [Paraglaciecola sp.]|jgi:hypothetical protein
MLALFSMIFRQGYALKLGLTEASFDLYFSLVRQLKLVDLEFVN